MNEVKMTHRKFAGAPLAEHLAAKNKGRISLLNSPSREQVSKRRLYKWSEIPEWQRDNEHIISGYVIETNSLWACLDSLFYLHNETVNVYSHLLPGICFFLVIVFNFYVLERFETTSLIDYCVIDFFFLGAFTCLMMSSLFHCLKCHSLEIAIFGNKLDYLGIVVLIVSSMVSILYYGFHDNKSFFFMFSGLTVIFGIACAIVSLGETFRSRDWRPYRASLFVAFGLSALLPVIAGLLKYGFKETWARIQLQWVILEGVFYISGAILYGIRFPERLAPGKFDIWGNSHQLFHLLVVVAALCHLRALIGSYELFHSQFFQ
ncbi:LADA_0B10220g1_1 [Lachancea dasiensis]|uniref:LADA_0B10220g1_1 n=1 Tax=Lachancea dasiensis TaxID=1072105 RepID=A0A1G4IV99_9SACH|nr:LADA_0B10220g1_1 [Lachancea dasiensis]